MEVTIYDALTRILLGRQDRTAESDRVGENDAI
jgi:hypothetical protein